MSTVHVILGIVGYIVMWFLTSLMFVKFDKGVYEANTLEDYMWISLFGCIWPVVFPFILIASLLKYLDK